MRVQWLQRGRRANAAESRRTAGRLPRPPMCFNGAAARTRRRAAHSDMILILDAQLQRGRRANAAERCVDSPACVQPDRLQRGRRANAAESRDAETIRLVQLLLQRGRRANAAESPVHQTDVRGGGRASTGPPRERGGEMVDIGSGMNLAALQRGRRANAAERNQVEAFAGAVPELQRGRRANATERVAVVLLAILRVCASTGPPRERGGEDVAIVWTAERVACFNGAAARTRRRGERLRSTDPSDRASTGPPRERGGEWPGSDPGGPRNTGFNGAAARTRRRGTPESAGESGGLASGWRAVRSGA